MNDKWTKLIYFSRRKFRDTICKCLCFPGCRAYSITDFKFYLKLTFYLEKLTFKTSKLSKSQEKSWGPKRRSNRNKRNTTRSIHIHALVLEKHSWFMWKCKSITLQKSEKTWEDYSKYWIARRNSVNQPSSVLIIEKSIAYLFRENS